jgi:hypothetical protein
MLVGACQEQGILSFENMPPLYNVRQDHGIEMADMRGSIDVEYRRRDVVRFLGCLLGRYRAIPGPKSLARRTCPETTRWDAR